MFPIHESKKLFKITKFSHYYIQQEKAKKRKRLQAEQARESRAFRAVAKLDLLTLPQTRLAFFIAKNFTVSNLSDSRSVILSLYLKKNYPENYYAPSVGLLHAKKKFAH